MFVRGLHKATEAIEAGMRHCETCKHRALRYDQEPCGTCINEGPFGSHWKPRATVGHKLHKPSHKPTAAHGQSRKHSFIEAWVNILIGFWINYVANLLIFPLFGFHISLPDNLWMGVIYTGISLVRSYFIRRYFNGWMVRMHLREGEGK